MIHRLRRIPRVVWLASACFCALLTFWSFANPLFTPPDEISHSDVVFHLATGASYPEYDERTLSQGVVRFGLTYGMILDDEADRARTVAAADRFDFGTTFDEYGGDSSLDTPNQIPQHPPLYYWGSAMTLRAARFAHGGQFAMHQEMHLLRLVNVALLSPLPLLAWATARRLGAPDRVGLAAALVPFAIPQLTHVGASVNNDNLFVALCAVLAVPLASVLRGDRRPRTALVVGAIAGLALLTKGLGVVLPVWIACCYAVPVIRQRRELAPAMKAAALAVFTTVGVGGWFTFRNLVVHGTPSPSIHAVTTAPDNFSPDLIAWLKEFPVHLTKGFWGYFGYYEVQIGTWATIGATAVTAVALAGAFAPRATSVERGAGTRRTELAGSFAILPLLFLFVAVAAWDLYTKTAYLRNLVQGRYLFGAVVPLAVCVAVGAARLLGRWATLAVLVTATTLQIVGLSALFDHWWDTPDGTLWTAFRSAAAWNPAPLPLFQLSALATVCSLAVLAYAASVPSARAPDPSLES
ncbi:MAG: hypothetical protein GX643_17775 [Acidimicrobiales bacterium]|nr:hypothetical protein [Acidimicrobiales bacterium]